MAALTLAAGALAACGGTSSSANTPAGGASSSSVPTATPSAAVAPTVSTGGTALGTVLVDEQGLTLYFFLPEKGSVVACTGGCASTWPAVKTSGTASKSSAVTGSLGTVALSDGSTQVTYNGWPLHTYAGDSASGQTNGQGVAGKWFAATPGLTASGPAASAATPTPVPGY